MEEEPVKPIQMNIYSSEAFKTDLDWPYFDKKEKQGFKRYSRSSSRLY